MSKFFVGLVSCLVALGGCSSGPLGTPETVVGLTFPQVEGRALSGERVSVPSAYRGAPVVLIIAYRQNSQFDVDRWVLGLLQAGISTRIVELPTIDGIVPGVVSEAIDSGMRSGIPSEDWPSVVTIYDDANRIIDAFGEQNPIPARVVLLNSSGVIEWFHDRGYSPRLALELRGRLERFQ
jgi:hypothetical protein